MKLEEEQGIVRVGRLRMPENREELRRWVETFLHLHLARQSVCEGHQVPLDYLEYVFFEEGDGAELQREVPRGDAVIWACRGGGKTMIGAVATLLDLLFKPGVQVRILGGSREQSEKMYTYLCNMVQKNFADQVKGKITRRGVRMKNGSACEILAQSARSVRGTRVQKLRCDEIELFDKKVWKAAQLATRSIVEPAGPDGEAGRVRVRGTVEVFSTMHQPGGLMQEICTGPAAKDRKVFTWCIFDIMGKCNANRLCHRCALEGDCNGRAKRAEGFVPLSDVLVMHQRVSKQAWENEMLCRLPYDENAVFAAFSRGTHERAWNLSQGQPQPGDAIKVEDRNLCVESVVAGVDFGFSCFVCLWMAMLRDEAGRRVVWVLDEYVARQKTLAAHLEAMSRRPVRVAEGDAWRPAVVYCDIAGSQHDAHTGETSLAVMRRAGFVVKAGVMEVEDGIGRLLALIDPAMNDGGGAAEGAGRPAAGAPVRFYVSGKCKTLIEALEGYTRVRGKPVKDGQHDHLIDALRYAVVNHDRAGLAGKMEGRLY